jgi:hypothetical protein
MAASVNQTVKLPRCRKGCIVGSRVRRPVPLLRDVVATLGIGFERNDTHPGQ